MGREDRVAELLRRYGRTYAEQAGIRLADKPSPLYRLLVLAVLLSARIDAGIAVAAAKELSKAGFRTPRRMADATWQQRVDALGRGHYRRYDERTATMLGDGAQLLLDQYRGDLRRLHDAAGSTRELERRLQDVPGIGPAGAAIFCREVQGVWTDVAPYVDDRAADGARKLGLPSSPKALAGLVPAKRLPALTALCVRATLDDEVAAAAQDVTRG
ncbi:endonuclease [Jiangella rhizosphaerae]|uniref:Endonuclease n=1 Tax=Jiangella rhizosphaerae TaxID=2293569 RepID=A0A418KPV0_9ACTN|nr:endonuclease [Jiangella rhizosphaerae]RIQ21488.1 endonuclease [Jiangella rhizosphaerae]